MKTPLNLLIEYATEKYGSDSNLANELIVKAIELKKIEKEQIIKFGQAMQVVRDVDFDGNIEFCFEPSLAFEKMFDN